MAHANARLTHFGRLLLVQRITELGWPPPKPPKPWGVASDRRQVAGPLPRPGPSRAGRPQLPAPPLPPRPAGQPGSSGPGRPPPPPPGPAPAGLAAPHAPLDDLWGVAPPSHEPPRPHRSGQRGRGPLPAGASRGAGPPGRQAGWAGSLMGVATAPTAAAPPPRGGWGLATTMSTRRWTTAPGSPSARSSPMSRGDGGAVPDRGSQLLRRPRGADPAGPDRQRQGLHRVGPVRRDGRWAGDPPQAHPPESAPDQRARSSGSTAPCWTNGPTPGCIAPTPSAAGPLAGGCGSTITGDHTPRSTA
jgi:hypothetical protein